MKHIIIIIITIILYGFLILTCFILSLVLNTNAHIEIHPVVGCCFFLFFFFFDAWHLELEKQFFILPQTHMHKHTDGVLGEWQFYGYHIQTHARTLTHTHTHAHMHLLAHRQGGQRDVPVQSVSAECLNMIATHPKAEHTHAFLALHFKRVPMCTGLRRAVSKAQPTLLLNSVTAFCLAVRGSVEKAHF